MKKTLAPVRNQLKSLLRQLDMDTTQSRDYQNLLYACLPASWRSRVLLGKQEGLQWQLWVANGGRLYPRRYYSEAEAEAVITAFIEGQLRG